MEYKVVMLSVVITVLVASLSGTQGCSELEPLARLAAHDESDDQKVYYSDYVVYGKPDMNVSGDQYPFNAVDGVQTVKFLVECIYKQDMDVANEIYVTGVGNLGNEIEGCPPAPLNKDKTAVLYLRKLDGDVKDLYEIEFAPVSETDDNPGDQILDDLTTVCGLLEQDEEKQETCYDPLTAPECFQYIPKTPAPPTQPVTQSANTTETNTTPNAGTEGTTKSVGNPITNNNNATYNTETEAGHSSQDESKDPESGAVIQLLSQSLAVLISVLYILV